VHEKPEDMKVDTDGLAIVTRNGDTDIQDKITSLGSVLQSTETNGLMYDGKEISMEIDDEENTQHDSLSSRGLLSGTESLSSNQVAVMKIGNVDIMRMETENTEPHPAKKDELVPSISVTAHYANNVTVESTLEKSVQLQSDKNSLVTDIKINEKSLANTVEEEESKSRKSTVKFAEEIDVLITTQTPSKVAAECNGVKLDTKTETTEEEKYVNGIPSWVILYCEKPECEERAYGSYPCFRCYKANYCSADHRNEHADAHKIECKIDSKLDGKRHDIFNPNPAIKC